MTKIGVLGEALKHAKIQGYTVPKLIKAEPTARKVKKQFTINDERRTDARFMSEVDSIKNGDDIYDAAFIPIEKHDVYTLMIYLKDREAIGFAEFYDEETLENGQLSPVIKFSSVPNFQKGFDKKFIRGLIKKLKNDQFAANLIFNCKDHLFHDEYKENLEDVSAYSEHINTKYINHDIFGDDISGDSYLYIYTYPSFIELYGAGVRNTLTLKIGKTKYGKSPTKRIYEQIRKSGITSQPEQPIILAYTVYDSTVNNLESAIHKELNEFRCRNGKLTGIEWFAVTPEALMNALYKHNCIANIESESSITSQLKNSQKELSLAKVSHQQVQELTLEIFEHFIKLEGKYFSFIWLYKLARGIHWKYYSDIENNPNIEYTKELYEELKLDGEYEYFKALTNFYSSMAKYTFNNYITKPVKSKLNL